MPAPLAAVVVALLPALEAALLLLQVVAQLPLLLLAQPRLLALLVKGVVVRAQLLLLVQPQLPV